MDRFLALLFHPLTFLVLAVVCVGVGWAYFENQYSGTDPDRGGVAIALGIVAGAFVLGSVKLWIHRQRSS